MASNSATELFGDAVVVHWGCLEKVVGVFSPTRDRSLSVTACAFWRCRHMGRGRRFFLFLFSLFPFLYELTVSIYVWK